MKLKLMYFSLITLLSSSSWALFCPNGFSIINMGDSIESVEQTCGKPDSQKKSKVTPNMPQEWVYYIASYPGMVGTLKTTIAFDASGKVINISVNGAGVSQTQICGGAQVFGAPTIQFGMTQDAVKAACGAPAYINQTTGAAAAAATEVVEDSYNSSPPVTLVFENGKLTSTK